MSWILILHLAALTHWIFPFEYSPLPAASGEYPHVISLMLSLLTPRPPKCWFIKVYLQAGSTDSRKNSSYSRTWEWCVSSGLWEDNGRQTAKITSISPSPPPPLLLGSVRSSFRGRVSRYWERRDRRKGSLSVCVASEEAHVLSVHQNPQVSALW